MVVTMSVDSLCGYKTYITAVTEGRKSHIHIETGCEKLKKWGCDFDLPNADLATQNIPYYELLMKSMKNKICDNCYVPATVMNAYWVETENISKTLARKIEKVELTIDKIE
ncbi:DUF6951 family protein [Methanolobus sp. ZRKC5]|uniref:DUF6951 family protein n=1 Tax=unclassified Methanolobus TaxID=2629569 RepID=UPI0029C7729D|nr:hypothetical protein [uncultured Methanolobus sp.]